MRITIESDGIQQDGKEKRIYEHVDQFALVGTQHGPDIVIPIFRCSVIADQRLLVALCGVLAEDIRAHTAGR